MPFFKGIKSKLGATAANTDKKAKPLPLRLTFTEQTQSDDHVVRSFDDLFSKTVRVWRGGHWHNDVKNGATGVLFDSSHHVPGEGAKDRSAFKDGKFGFCLEWIDFPYDGEVYRVRCMNEFCIKSQQCTDHQKTVYKDGPNRVYDLMNRGGTVTYGMIKDTDAPEVPLTNDQRKSKALEHLKEVENRLDEAYATGLNVVEMRKQYDIVQRAIKDKSYLLEDRSDAAPQPGLSAPILSARRSANNSAPGNAALDAKARRNPNGKKKGKTNYTNDLESIQE
ncbi:hypothetical protein J4E91_009281 [Alternaria rosae]|nr:hypothetical protein J4E91_009281 [Alternaria rosae]